MSATLINGKPDCSIPVADRGFQYGDGVFETLRVVNRQPTLWTLHSQRLLAGCRFLGIPLIPKVLEEELQQLLNLNVADGVVKIIITRGSGGRGYQPPNDPTPSRVLQFFPLPENLEQVSRHGARIKRCHHPLSRNSSLVRFKHLCRLDQVIASSELSADFAEGIMLTDTEHVIEGTRSNLFMAYGNQLMTPALNEAGVQGVMRQHLIQHLLGRGNSVQEKTLNLNDLYNADEVFLCNSVFGVWPVTELVDNDRTVQYPIGKFTGIAAGIADEVFFIQS